MLSQIVQQSSDYYSFGQYIFHASKEAKRETCNLVDLFISKVPMEELEFIITTMSASLNGIMADKRNERNGKSEETAAKTRQVKSYTTYNSYIMDLCEQQVPPSMVPSLYAHVHNEKTYYVVIDPQDEPKYTYQDKNLSYGELLRAMLEQSKRNSANIKIPQVKEATSIAAVISGHDMDDIALKKVVLPKDMIDDAKFVKKQLSECVTDTRIDPVVRSAELLRKEGGLSFKDDTRHINVLGSGVINHRGLDKYGVVSNGAITKEYYKKIKLDPTLKSSEQAIHFLNTLKTAGPSTYWNVSWVKDLRDPELVEALKHYWFVLLPGGQDIVLQRLDDNERMPLWETPKVLDSYLTLINRAHTMYSLARLAAGSSMSDFLHTFIPKNGLFVLRGALKFSFRLFSLKVMLKIELSKAKKKVGDKLFTIASQLMNASLFENIGLGDDDSDEERWKNIKIDELLLFDDDEPKKKTSMKNVKSKKEQEKSKKKNSNKSNTEEEAMTSFLLGGKKKTKALDEVNPFENPSKKKKAKKIMSSSSSDSADRDDQKEEKNVESRSVQAVVEPKTYSGGDLVDDKKEKSGESSDQGQDEVSGDDALDINIETF